MTQQITMAAAQTTERVLGVRPDLRRALLLLSERGNCANPGNPDAWYDTPVGHARARAYAAALCRGCPVLAQCRAYALDAGEEYGVWGGLCELDRAQLRDVTTARTRHMLKVRVILPADEAS